MVDDNVYEKVCMNPKEKEFNLVRRFLIYQSERFNFIQNGIMILAFTFSAASYSRICRGAEGFISLDVFFTGFLISLAFFFLLRVFDEFKDAKDDAKYRPYRAVPRGLISLKEVGWIGFFTIIFQIVINCFFLPEMLWAYFLGLGYILLMAKEFFVPEWLRTRPIMYLVSHMFVMPLIDFYTTGLDWINAGVQAPRGLIFFLIVTFLNGIVIEIGRKIRAKEAEEEGVETYSALYGAKKATISWLIILFITFIFAMVAVYFAGFGQYAQWFLILFLGLSSFPAFRFLKTKKQKHAKQIELSAGVWTIAMYLTLGGVPMLIKLFL